MGTEMGMGHGKGRSNKNDISFLNQARIVQIPFKLN